MSVIKNLAFVNKKRLTCLSSFKEAEISVSDFPSFPFDILHAFLPFKCKFMNESFVSIEDKKINGLITANKTDTGKIKITRLLLEENAATEGKLLVNFVTTFYSAKGAETFYIVVNKADCSLLSMLKNGCNFKKMGAEIIYRVPVSDFKLADEAMNFEFIRKFSRKDLNAVRTLNQNIIPTYKKVAFEKTAKSFNKQGFNSIEQYVAESELGKIISYFSILKLRESEYLLDFMIDIGHEGYIKDIITFVKAKVLKNKKTKTLYIKLKNYYSNFENLKGTLDLEYKNSTESEILIKDYILTAKQSYPYERMIFNDITPAY